MKLVLLSHPNFLRSQSMPRFASMLETAFRARGHDVEVWAPQPYLYSWTPRGRLSKWAGYVDQYLLFPLWLRKRIAAQPVRTLFVFCDQALGPWVPLAKHLPHVVHCHDLLALRSALGEIPENPTSWTGRIYQRYIRWGFRQARHFVSVSKQSQRDLHRVGGVRPLTSEVVYNGLNHAFAPMPREEALRLLLAEGLPADERGMLIHVGGAQWYKNTAGVIAIYAQYASAKPDPLPLWMISPPPSDAIARAVNMVPKQGKVLFVQGLEAEALRASYSLARALVFPSHAEGFGWPIAEALACGCPVLTTGEAPMTEVGGAAARYIQRRTARQSLSVWAIDAALELEKLLSLGIDEGCALSLDGRTQAAKFDASLAIDTYLRIYAQVLAEENAWREAGSSGPNSVKHRIE